MGSKSAKYEPLTLSHTATRAEILENPKNDWDWKVIYKRFKDDKEFLIICHLYIADFFLEREGL